MLHKITALALLSPGYAFYACPPMRTASAIRAVDAQMAVGLLYSTTTGAQGWNSSQASTLTYSFHTPS